MRINPTPLLLLGFCSTALVVHAAQVPEKLQHEFKPLKAGSDIVSNHPPFENGECSSCHERDGQDPGPLTKQVNKICLECHEDYQRILGRKFPHAAAAASCVNCHSPHNSTNPKLLLESATSLCLACHADKKSTSIEAPVKHDAVFKGAGCLSCHDPHATEGKNLLGQAMMPLCLSCHGKDNLVDHNGKKLANFKKLLELNPHLHGPVEECSTCHDPHGSQYFRLLTKEYPADFYAPYAPKHYALCFDCHEESAFASVEADNTTRFRDGKRNLHYLHVNKEELGRTCRACHDVHASKHEHQIRDQVPYGSSGWTLKINFEKTPTGGTCAKTCHQAKSYTNTDTNSK